MIIFFNKDTYQSARSKIWNYKLSCHIKRIKSMKRKTIRKGKFCKYKSAFFKLKVEVDCWQNQEYWQERYLVYCLFTKRLFASVKPPKALRLYLSTKPSSKGIMLFHFRMRLLCIFRNRMSCVCFTYNSTAKSSPLLNCQGWPHCSKHVI